MREVERTEGPETIIHPWDKPLAVTIIGWLFVGVGALSILGGLMMLWMWQTVLAPLWKEMPTIPPDLPAWAKLAPLYFRYFIVVPLAVMAVSVFVLIAAVEFLKLRAWARTALEAVSWLHVAYVIGSGILWLVIWVTLSSQIPSAGEEGMTNRGVFMIYGVVMGMVVILFWAVPAGVIIYFLRSKTVRGAFVRTG